MKKILLLIPALNAGGAERVMVTLANEWSKENDVNILVFNDGNCFYSLSERVNIKGLNISPKSNGIGRFMSIPKTEILRYKQIVDEICVAKYDFILSFCYTTNVMASLISMRQKNKIIVSERNDPYKYPTWLRILVVLLYRKNLAVICQNMVVKQYFSHKKFKNNLMILPNPVNYDDIPKKRPEKMRKEIVTVGRLIPQKNHKMLIEAFNIIKDEFPDYILKIFGTGPSENELKKLIVSLGISNRVKLMGVKKRVMYYVNEASIFVLSSDFEGFPNVLIEAMGTGMPVISTKFRTGIAEELIRDGYNGYLTDTGSVESMAKALKKMLSRERDFLTMGEVNRKIASRYSGEFVANNWLTEISKVID